MGVASARGAGAVMAVAAARTGGAAVAVAAARTAGAAVAVAAARTGGAAVASRPAEGDAAVCESIDVAFSFTSVGPRSEPFGTASPPALRARARAHSWAWSGGWVLGAGRPGARGVSAGRAAAHPRTARAHRRGGRTRAPLGRIVAVGRTRAPLGRIVAVGRTRAPLGRIVAVRRRVWARADGSDRGWMSLRVHRCRFLIHVAWRGDAARQSVRRAAPVGDPTCKR